MNLIRDAVECIARSDLFYPRFREFLHMTSQRERIRRTSDRPGLTIL